MKKQTIETGADRTYQDWAFGCDICQDVCPWNRFSHPHQEAKFKPIEGLLNMSKDAWLEMEETSFKARFKQSPLLRSKLSGIKKYRIFKRSRPITTDGFILKLYFQIKYKLLNVVILLPSLHLRPSH